MSESSHKMKRTARKKKAIDVSLLVNYSDGLVETPAEWLDTECIAEDILPPDTLLTERILGDEELDMVTASTAFSAPKIPLT